MCFVCVWGGVWGDVSQSGGASKRNVTLYKTLCFIQPARFFFACLRCPPGFRIRVPFAFRSVPSRLISFSTQSLPPLSKPLIAQISTENQKHHAIMSCALLQLCSGCCRSAVAAALPLLLMVVVVAKVGDTERSCALLCRGCCCRRTAAAGGAGGAAPWCSLREFNFTHIHLFCLCLLFIFGGACVKNNEKNIFIWGVGPHKPPTPPNTRQDKTRQDNIPQPHTSHNPPTPQPNTRQDNTTTHTCPLRFSTTTAQ